MAERLSGPVRPLLLIVMAVLLFGTGSAQAQAAGTIVVEQQSQIDQYGGWRLSTPSGMVVNRKKERSMSVNAVEGQYLLTVEAPEGAVTTVRFYDGNTLINTTAGTQVAFVFSGNGALRVEISYHYEGVVTVESAPSGASFELKGPQGVRLTGITPATFTQIPPFYFTASFSPLPGCQQPKPQSRTLRPNSTLAFQADYTCVNEFKMTGNTPPPSDGIPAPVATTPATLRMLDEQSRANVRVFQSVSQEETVPGGTVQVTIGVRNVGKTTLRNVTLTEQFDAALLSLPDTLPEGGMYTSRQTAVWEIPEIFAGQSFSVTFPVRMSAGARQGDVGSLTVRVSGDGVHAPAGELLVKMVRIGAAALPATGWKADLLFALLSAAGLGLLPLLQRNRRESFVASTVE